jgi:hypothetical protein
LREKKGRQKKVEGGKAANLHERIKKRSLFHCYARKKGKTSEEKLECFWDVTF